MRCGNNDRESLHRLQQASRADSLAFLANQHAATHIWDVPSVSLPQLNRHDSMDCFCALVVATLSHPPFFEANILGPVFFQRGAQILKTTC